VKSATTRSDADRHGVKFDRERLLAERNLSGAAWCEQYTRVVDHWLAALFDAASPPAPGVALVAVGGYGRSELCPSSDIDLMLVHDKRVNARHLADRIWYPIWDGGLKLGHSVCTVRQALSLAGDDLDTATALLSARLVAGDERVVTELGDQARAQWRGGARRWLEELARRVDERHASAGEVAFLLEPDLKEGRGGMRDVHALKWAEVAERVLFVNDEQALDAAYGVLLDARVELQRATGRSLNVLTRQDQTTVASALGAPSAEALMRRVAEAARAIAWMSDDTWRRVRSGLRGPPGRGAGSVRLLGHGVVERGGEICADDKGSASNDPLLPLRVAVASAQKDVPIERATLDRLRETMNVLPTPWPAEARSLFHELLLAGRPAIGVIEALDHHGIWERFVPEWVEVRARPQNNPYHRFTVDRHLLETVANASELASAVERPDLLVLAALIHDLGKGRTRHHTDVGVELAMTIGTRMGGSAADVDVLCALVRHHLLLSDVASRRDLDDDATIDLVASAVESIERLELLAVLTEADARATGPTAWGTWKAELVAGLVARVGARLRGGPAPPSAPSSWSDIFDVALLDRDTQQIVAEDGIVAVVTSDRPGAFSRVAGVLALRGLDVLEAVAYSTPQGQALSRFRVADRLRDQTPWPEIVADLKRALEGRLAIDARLADRARTHARHRRFTTTASATVRFDNLASEEATVIDVEAPDAIGMLYRITKAFSDLDLDIRSAKVQTLGAHVIDAFYVRDQHGKKILDGDALGEIERAVLHAVTEGVAASRSTATL
jgi:[protein-PII] uridylyltransferase